MAVISTYRRYVSQLTAGLRYLQAHYGQRFVGTVGLFADLVSEGARWAFLGRLPHEGNTEDFLDAAGADRKMLRFRDEPLSSWRQRVGDAWEECEQAGTAIQVLRAVNAWGQIRFGWGPYSFARLSEGHWAIFDVWLLPGLVSWTAPAAYGSGETYGKTELLYGVSNAHTEDVAALAFLVSKWKPARSQATITVVLSGNVYGQPNLIYGLPGLTYEPASTFVLHV
jgi:hypothetical protein